VIDCQISFNMPEVIKEQCASSSSRSSSSSSGSGSRNSVNPLIVAQEDSPFTYRSLKLSIPQLLPAGVQHKKIEQDGGREVDGGGV